MSPPGLQTWNQFVDGLDSITQRHFTCQLTNSTRVYANDE